MWVLRTVMEEHQYHRGNMQNTKEVFILIPLETDWMMSSEQDGSQDVDM